jgi:AraC-like DNA-binding protein
MSIKRATFTVRGSVADRVLKFFEDNPDEELTPQDIQDKFGASTSGTSNLIRRHGDILECVHVVRLRSKGIAQ